VTESEFPLEFKVSFEDNLEVILKVSVVSVVVADGKRKIRTRRIPPDETSDEASSSSLSRSSTWSVADGEAWVDAVSIGSCMDDMVVKWRMSMNYEWGG